MMNADGGATSGYTTAAAAAAGDKKYKGVRRRKWGRWVSEIRLPNSRERIWLGSYDTPDKAARAFDAAFVCLRGHRAGQLNFPESPPPRIPGGGRMLSPHEIQAAAASHANRALPGEAAAAPIAAEDSPAASDGMTAESGDAFDWSFMDTWLSPARASGAEFGPVIEDFTSEFFSTELEPTAAAEEVEDSSPNGLDSNSILWNF